MDLNPLRIWWVLCSRSVPCTDACCDICSDMQSAAGYL